jgi:mannose-6-phosphate isomerase-like protein (cupin superfamily)
MADKFRFADVGEVIAKFPDTAPTLLVDAYLSDRAEASIRLFRLYDTLPAHHHQQCDELLYLLRGRVRFEIEGEPARELGAGQLVVFLRGVVHAVTPVGGDPAVFLSADTPRRDPKDVHFTDPAAARGKAFVTHLPGYGPEDGAR